jgi:hypothetical protein
MSTFLIAYSMVVDGAQWNVLTVWIHFGKKCKSRGIHYYLYKGMVRVLTLSMEDELLGIATCGNKSVALNTFINTHIEMKKLKFHTADTTGKSKCHKIYVGKQNQLCPELRVHGSTMQCVNSDTYLGDIISSDGSNGENIRKRISKGNGIIYKIKILPDSVILGAHYFEIALMLRESLLLNGILTSSQKVWYYQNGDTRVRKCGYHLDEMPV